MLKIVLSPEYSARLEQDLENGARLSGVEQKLRSLDIKYEDMQRTRRMVALKNTLRKADELYDTGKIDNRDSAIVIGAGHYEYYADYGLFNRARRGETDYNLVTILPKGIEEFLNN